MYQSFRKLKKALTSALILGYLHTYSEYWCQQGRAGYRLVLGVEESHRLFQQNVVKAYCVISREFLDRVEHFYKYYLYGRKFLLRTDHAALKWLLTFRNPEGQVARSIERLKEFDFRYRALLIKAHMKKILKELCKYCYRLEGKDNGPL